MNNNVSTQLGFVVCIRKERSKAAEVKEDENYSVHWVYLSVKSLMTLAKTVLVE